MKLIRCIKCDDVVRLVHTRWRTCDCKESGGQYNKDMMTATVAGSCDIVGISNLFFDNKFRALSEPDKVKFRKKIGHHYQEIWYGENPGDIQIVRIQSPLGPRIKMSVERVDDYTTRSIINDRRKYTVDGKRLKEIVTGNEMKPSFRDKKHRENSGGKKI